MDRLTVRQSRQSLVVIEIGCGDLLEGNVDYILTLFRGHIIRPVRDRLTVDHVLGCADGPVSLTFAVLIDRHGHLAFFDGRQRIRQSVDTDDRVLGKIVTVILVRL